MTYLWMSLITFYQRFISPYKGFRCAHNVKHQTGSCSYAVKALISEYGLISALPFIRSRFRACQHACNDLHRNAVNLPTADLPCDVSCAEGIFDCSTSAWSERSAMCECVNFCSPSKGARLSRSEKRFIIGFFLLAILLFSYLFYGRGINAVYITDHGSSKQSLVSRITQRDDPQVRLLLVTKNEKVYSETISLDDTQMEYKLALNHTLFSFDIERLEIHDARLNVGNKLLVLGQKLEVFEQPESQGQGQRFDYRLQRRWHF